jgi:hypothetical protein
VGSLVKGVNLSSSGSSSQDDGQNGQISDGDPTGACVLTFLHLLSWIGAGWFRCGVDAVRSLD